MEIKGLRDSVTDALRTQIITGQLAPGQRVNEADLCDMLNVSRSPLRESLLILEAEDLVRRVPRRGTYVTEMSEENLRMIYQVTTMVEMYALDQLEEKGIRDVPRLEAAVEKCTVGDLSPQDVWKDLAVHRKSLASFHGRLVETLENPAIISFYRNIASSLARYQFLHLAETRSGKAEDKDHRLIIDCIKRGAYSEAKAILRRHIGVSLQHKLDSLGVPSTLEAAN
jgi:DNA-binding GntR family transcriptional regulator